MEIQEMISYFQETSMISLQSQQNAILCDGTIFS